MSKEEKVRVEVTIGPATVRVEAPPDKLEEALKQVVSALRSALPGLAMEGAGRQVERVRRERRPQPTCTGLLRQLVGEGWFDRPRTLSETVQELARRGYSYNSTAVSHSLLDLVRERVLVREGSPRRYTYIRASDVGGEKAESQASF